MNQVPWDAHTGAAGGNELTARLVPGQHVRAFFVGARHAVRPDAAAGEAPDASRSIGAKACSSSTSSRRISPSSRCRAAGALVVAAQRSSIGRRQAPALYDRHHLKRPARARHAPRRELAARASGRQRLVGRNPALLPAERDGAEGARLSQRPSGDRKGARSDARAAFGIRATRFSTSPAFRPTGTPRSRPRRCSIRALRGDHPALRDAAKWLIDHQIFKRGDWSIKRPDLEPGGWAFEFYNDWYPDVDDSAVILMVLADAAARRCRRARARDQPRRELGDGDAVEGRRFRRLRRRQRFELAQLGDRCADVEAGHRSDLSRPDRPRARDDGGGRLSRRPSGGAPRDRVAQARSGGRTARGGGAGASTISTALVSALSGLRAIGVRPERAVDSARGRVAQVEAESPTADGARAASDKDPAWRGQAASARRRRPRGR